jgi:hypothetical protein
MVLSTCQFRFSMWQKPFANISGINLIKKIHKVSEKVAITKEVQFLRDWLE